MSRLYQLEVKRYLVEYRFNPANGWTVSVDVDAMELGHGGKHPADKKDRAHDAKAWLERAGAKIGPHPRFGRTDVVAEHSENGIFLIEVEGDTSKQKEQAMYSALGQAVIQMADGLIHYGLAVPDAPEWERQLKKIPERIKRALNLSVWLVSERGARTL